MAPVSPPASPTPSRAPELVEVDTALAVLRQVNLLAESRLLALDIGGSLAKLVYLQPYGTRTTAPPLIIHRVAGSVASALSVHVPELKGTLHFFAFETRNVSELLRFIRRHWVRGHGHHRLIRATGGGSYKYAATFDEEIGVRLARLDEMSCTVAGLNFLLTTVKNEVYVYLPPAEGGRKMGGSEAGVELARTTQFVDKNANPFPYLLVNIGSGVSIVKVTAHDKFERVSGSALGGGTFWGLARMLLDCETFDDIIELTHDGDNSNVDMLVGDIYGGSYSSLGLDSGIIAASFGKATMRHDALHEESVLNRIGARLHRAFWGSLDLWMSVLDAVPILGDLVSALRPVDGAVPTPGMMSVRMRQQFRPQDIALSLLRMVSYNIAQIAFLNARVHNLDRIYFGGNFIQNHPYTVADISFAVDFWSGGKMQALFLHHDGYLGAIGAFIGASSAAPTRVFDEQQKKSKRSFEAAKATSSVATQEAHVKDDGILPMNGMLELTPPALDQDGKPRQQISKQKVAKKKTKKTTEPDVSAMPAASADESQNREAVVENEMEDSDGKAGTIDPEGEWTTVTRIRRRSGAKEKAP